MMKILSAALNGQSAANFLFPLKETGSTTKHETTYWVEDIV